MKNLLERIRVEQQRYWWREGFWASKLGQVKTLVSLRRSQARPFWPFTFWWYHSKSKAFPCQLHIKRPWVGDYETEDLVWEVPGRQVGRLLLSTSFVQVPWAEHVYTPEWKGGGGERKRLHSNVITGAFSGSVCHHVLRTGHLYNLKSLFFFSYELLSPEINTTVFGMAPQDL